MKPFLHAWNIDTGAVDSNEHAVGRGGCGSIYPSVSDTYVFVSVSYQICLLCCSTYLYKAKLALRNSPLALPLPSPIFSKTGVQHVKEWVGCLAPQLLGADGKGRCPAPSGGDSGWGQSWNTQCFVRAQNKNPQTGWLICSRLPWFCIWNERLCSIQISTGKSPSQLACASALFMLCH